jgi:hypothetical protein
MPIYSQALRIVQIAVLSGALLSACSSPPPAAMNVSPLSTIPSPLPTVQSQKTVSTPVPPEPTAGQASISGVLYSSRSGGAIPGTMFYLTPAVGPEKRSMPSILIGPEESRGDIRGQSDEVGGFTLNNIPPGNYFLIAWSPYNWPEADVSATDMTPLLIELKAQQRKPLGNVYVGWP